MMNMIKDIEYFIEEIEAQSYEILNHLKYNEVDIAIVFLNEMIDYIRKFKGVNNVYKSKTNM